MNIGKAWSQHQAQKPQQTKFTELLERKGREQDHGSKFDPSDLLAVDPQIINAFNKGHRVKLERDYGNGEIEIRTGTIGVTTGWKPAFLLMKASNHIGSSYLIEPYHKVIAVKPKTESRYLPVTDWRV